MLFEARKTGKNIKDEVFEIKCAEKVQLYKNIISHEDFAGGCFILNVSFVFRVLFRSDSILSASFSENLYIYILLNCSLKYSINY